MISEIKFEHVHKVVSVVSVAGVGVIKLEAAPVVYPTVLGLLREIFRTVKEMVELELGLILKVGIEEEANAAGSSAVPVAQIAETVVF